MTPLPDDIARLQRRIHWLALAGLLMTGLLVAIATAVPMYQLSRAQIEVSTQQSLRSQAQAVAQLFERFEDVSLQVASRTQIREALDAYNRWEISLVELVSFSAPRLRDALDQVGNVAGMVRFDENNYPVVELGQPLAGHWLSYAARTEAATLAPGLHGPLELAGALHLLAEAPILARDGRRIGTDILIFDLTQLDQLLHDTSSNGVAAQRFLYGAYSNTLLWQNAGASRIEVVDGHHPARALLERSAAGTAGMTRIDLDDAPCMFFHMPLPGRPGWAFAIAIHRDELYAPILSELRLPLATMALLVLLGAFATTRAIGPLTDEAVAQSLHAYELGREQRSLLELANGFVFRTDDRGTIVELSPGAKQVTGFDSDAMLTKALGGCLGNLLREALTRDRAAAPGNEGERRSDQVVFEDAPRGRLILEVSLLPRFKGDRIIGLTGVARDITEKILAQEHIQHLAHYDVLTDLPNRALMLDRLDHAVLRGERTHNRIAVLFADLDGFKYVNDSLGHPVGDWLLREVAHRFSAVMRAPDTIARVGGDEFLVMIEDVLHPQDAARVAEKLIETLRTPFVHELGEFVVGVSIGISLAPDDGHTAEELIRCADAAMYRAKAGGRNTWRFHNEAVAKAGAAGSQHV